ncbi:MAG: KR domain-containing protein, partial [Mycolicibacterium sp.]|nr:KR domain-containing protein [Mycolicibacterium sp.]
AAPEASPLALLDAAFHIAPLADITDPRLYVVAGVGQVSLNDAVPERGGSVSTRRSPAGDGEVIIDVTIANGDGATYVSMRSLRYRALNAGAEVSQSGSDARRFAHTIEWRPRPDTDDAGSLTDSPTVAVLGDDGAGGEVIREGLRTVGYASADLSAARYLLYLADSGPADAAETDLESAVRMCTEVTELVRALAERDTDNPASLWIITRGVHEAVNASGVRQGTLWGLAGVITSERPDLWGGLVDIAAGSDLADCVRSLGRILPTRNKNILVLRDGVFLAPVLAPVTGEPVRTRLRCRPDAAYLITGGMGALGLLIASWLADHGARHLLLAGRTPLPPRPEWDRDVTGNDLRQQISAIRALETRGVSVELVTADVGRRGDVRALLAKRDRDAAPPIRGIVHAAGVTNDELVTKMTGGAMREVMWPKISGGQVLHEAFPPGSLDFFYLTASAASVFGIPGQGSYAAANAYLDALARGRHRQGCHTLSLDWVAWRGLGFAAGATLAVEELRRMGSREITPSEAFAAWEYVDTFDIARTVVVPVPSSHGDGGSIVADQSGVGTPDWSRMSPIDVRDRLEIGLRTIIARELRLPEVEVEMDRPFGELGLNSLMAMAIRREAKQLVGLELSATMLFNHPTIAALADYLAKTVAPADAVKANAVASLSASAGTVLGNLFDRVESRSGDAESPAR